MKRSIFKLLPFLLVFALLQVSCKKDDEIDTSLLAGCWQREGTSEYWRYDSGGSGETWVESDDVYEGEGTRFTWTTEKDQLYVTLRGEMGQEVPRDYTIKSLSSSELVLEENFYSTETTYRRVSR